MKSLTPALAALLLLAPASTPFAQELSAQVQAELPSLISLYKELHANPELSMHEVETSTRIASELRSAGLQVTEKVGGHGLVGVLKNGDGPVILVRTDLDALPVTEQTGTDYASKKTVKDDLGREVGVMHACGHDIHMATFIGTARVLAKMKRRWSGTLVMIGQPAEERVLGARLMLRAGLFEKFPRPDKAIALHCASDMPHGTIGIVEGYALANVDTVEIIVKGVGGHGSMPHLSKDPIVLAAQIVLALQTIVSREVRPGDPAVVTVGSIHGGTKSNIISDEVRLQLTLRSYKAETRQHLIDSIKRIVRAQAESAGMPAAKMPEVIVSDDQTPALYNQPALCTAVRGYIGSEIGPDNVLTREPVMGAEDFAEYGLTKEKVPLCMFWLGTQDPRAVLQAKEKATSLPSLHSPLFQPVPAPSIETGVRAMTSAVLGLFRK
ncbi:MAG: amidohydrolase [Verrucomicrobiaceae bacterium]|nr:amidohydrolase [Verrucomicrobiaceae bacterium]